MSSACSCSMSVSLCLFLVLVSIALSSCLVPPNIISEWNAPPTFDVEGRTDTPDGPLLGNGDMGVVIGAQIGGAVASVSYYVGLNQYWAINYTEGTYAPHHWPYIDDVFFSRLMTLGSVVYAFGPLPIKSFHARQDIYRGQVEVEFLDANGRPLVSINSFVSATAGNWLVSNVVVKANTVVNVTTATQNFTVVPNVTFPTTAGCTDANAQSVPCANVTPKTPLNADFITRTLNFQDTNVFPVEGALATRLLSSSGATLLASSSSALSTTSTVSVMSDSPFVIVTGAHTNLDAVKMNYTSYVRPPPQFPIVHPLPLLQHSILLLTDDVLSLVYRDHLHWWNQFYYGRGSMVSLPDDNLLERFWWGAQYISATSMRVGKVPSGLWGPWVYSDSMGWHGDYTLDYNYEAPFWHLYSTNRIEEASVQYCMIMQYMPVAIHEAAYLKATTEAVVFPAHITAYGFSASLGPDGHLLLRYLAAFTSLNMIQHYEYTLDEAFLANTLYPFLRLQMNWYVYWLRNETFNGTHRWVDPQDCTNENCNGGIESPLNSVWALAFIRRVMTITVQFATHLKVDNDQIPIWIDMVTFLAQYPTGLVNVTWNGAQTQWIIWIYAEDSTHNSDPSQNGQPLSAVTIFPTETIGLHSPSHLVSLGLRSIAFAGFTNANAFPWVFPSAARVGYPVFELLKAWNTQLSQQTYPNLWYHQDGGGIETIGGVEGVNNMLMQSNEWAIELFPVWPHNHSAAFTQLRAKGAFLINATYNATTLTLEDIFIESERGVVCAFQHPWRYTLQQKNERATERFEAALRSGSVPTTNEQTLATTLWSYGRTDVLSMDGDTVVADVLVVEMSADGTEQQVDVVLHHIVPSGYGFAENGDEVLWIEFSTKVNGRYRVSSRVKASDNDIALK